MGAAGEGGRAVIGRVAIGAMVAAIMITGIERGVFRPRESPRHYEAHRASSPLAIDGKLNDAAWRRAAWTEEFVDIQGDTQPKPRFDTRVKMLWDDEYFYVGADLREPHVWATLTQHDSVIFHDPDFEVFIDPNGDRLEYYEFEINARGTYWDLFLPKPYKEGGKAQNGWEIPGLKSAVWVDGTLNDARDTDRGWSVELAFPWRVLAEYAHQPAPPRDGDEWRVNFSRVEWPIEIDGRDYRKRAGAREDNWVWSHQDVVDMHRPERWGTVAFRQSKGPKVQGFEKSGPKSPKGPVPRF